MDKRDSMISWLMLLTSYRLAVVTKAMDGAETANKSKAESCESFMIL